MRSAALSCLVLLGLSAPALAGPYTLCRPDEIVVFSCSTGVRFLSICASKDISKSRGYMQYRFGPRGRPEMAYPETTERPAKVFSLGNLMFSGGGGTYLVFAKEPYRYTVFSAVGKWGPHESSASASGVSVRKGGEQVADIGCHPGGNHADGEFGPDFFEKIGLGAADPDFEIPESLLPQ